MHRLLPAAVRAGPPDGRVGQAGRMKDATRHRVLAAWAALVGVPAESFSHEPLVRIAPESRTCPPGWVGVVAIERVFLATAPAEPEATAFRQVLASWTGDGGFDPRALAGRLKPAETLGLISLSYLDTDSAWQAHPRDVESVPLDAPELIGLLESCDGDDVDESGLGHIASPAFVARDAGKVVAAAGYQIWQRELAHIGVLTARPARRRGLATAVAGAATRHALAKGLVAQWRTRTPASLKVAGHLGFEEVGWQLAFRLGPAWP